MLPPHHRLGRKKDISLKEIEHERFLITGSGKLKTFIDNILTANGISPKEQIILGDRDAVKSADQRRVRGVDHGQVNCGKGLQIGLCLSQKNSVESPQVSDQYYRP